MSKITNKLPFFIQSIVYVIIGFILFLKPDTSLVLVSRIISSLLILVGAINAVRSLVKKEGSSYVFPMGILCVIIGAYLFYKPATISNILVVLLGFCIVLSGVLKLQNAIELLRAKAQGWWVFLIISVLILAYGLIMVFNPFKHTQVLIKFLGVGFIVSGILDFISNIIVSNKT